MSPVVRSLGLNDDEHPDTVSSSRVIMFLAFAILAAVIIYAAVMIGLNRPAVLVGENGQVTTTFSHYSDLVKETGSYVKYFIIPKIAKEGKEALVKRAEARGDDS